VEGAWSFEAIGTHWEITFPENTSHERIPLMARIAKRIKSFDQTYSRFREDSLVTKMSHEAGVYELPQDAEPLLALYQDLYTKTNGSFTPLIGQVLSDAGYDATYSLQSKELRTVLPLDEVLAYSSPMLTMHQPALLDFGAAGKGYLVDLIAEIIEEASDGDYLINAGGDIRVRMKEPAQIGLEHPDDFSVVAGLASLTSGSICGSAVNRRVWGEYHHVMNPHTLASTKGIKAVWVTAPTALVADALTTALFFSPAQTLEAEYTFEYLLIRDDLSIERSDAFSAELFT
jgi:thiamine biosynthesis lipoprotein